MIGELTSKSCLWTVQGFGLGTDLKKTASGGAFWAERFVSNSRLISDSCWNRSSIVWPPPVFADEGPGAVPSVSTDEAGTADGGRRLDAAGAATVFATVGGRGPDEVTVVASSGCTDGAGAIEGFEEVVVPELV